MVVPYGFQATPFACEVGDHFFPSSTPVCAISTIYIYLSDVKLEEAKTRREFLRAELHEYGALSPEPDWGRCCQQVEAVINGSECEEFLRKAGGLKYELVNLVQVRQINEG